MSFFVVLHVLTLRHDSFDDDENPSATLVYLPAIPPSHPWKLPRGKDLSRASDEVDFYEMIKLCQEASGAQRR